LTPTVSYEQAKREKLLANLLSEPQPEPETKPKDLGEEFQKQSYIEQTRQAEERKKKR